MTSDRHTEQANPHLEIMQLMIADKARRRLWNRIATVGVGIWISGTLLISLIRGREFQFWNDRYNDYEPETAFWFALTGVVLVVVICGSIPWILIAARPRPFWKRIGITGSSIWVGTTILYSLLHPNFNFGSGNSDAVLWFALVGGALVYGVCWSVPWVMEAARSS